MNDYMRALHQRLFREPAAYAAPKVQLDRR